MDDLSYLQSETIAPEHSSSLHGMENHIMQIFGLKLSKFVRVRSQVQIYILGIDEQGKLQSGYLQVHRQEAARKAATGSALAQIDISVDHVVGITA